MSDFVEFLHEVFADLGPITTRRMFGAQSSQPFTFEQRGKQVKLSYWSAPDFVLDDREKAAQWAQSALEAAMRSQEAKDRHANRLPWRRN